MRIKLLSTLIFYCALLTIQGQSVECPLDESKFSGTVTTTNVGGTKIKANDATSNYRFGERVAIDGNIAVAASRANGNEAGKVYIYINDGSGNWSLQTTVSASDGFAGDNFGSDVAIEGNYLLVGARSQLDTNNVDTGAAYLFEYDEINTWTQVARFEPSDGATDYRFGTSVAIEANLILIGARKGCTGGCAYLYENDGTNTFTYTETKLEPQVQSGYSGARFGETVALKDGRAFVGGPYDYSSVGRASAGSVQVWDQQNDGSWSRTQRLRGTETSESFGWEFDIEGDYLAVGAMNFEVSSTAEADNGRVFVYKADSNGDYLEANRVMVQNDDKDSFPDQRFGSSVALHDGFLYVGTWGDGITNGDAVYIFKDDGTNNWIQIAKITTGSGWDEFSNRSLAVSFPNLLIGQNEDDSPSNSGAIHFIPLANTIQPTASVNEVVNVNTGQNNGVIKVSFNDEATETQIKFSTDGGVTYPHVFDDDLGNAEITGLAEGSYDIWVAFNENSCPINLGVSVVSEILYTAIPDTNFELALEALGYDDASNDGKVPTSFIETITTLDVSNKSISNLEGIEDFTALIDLNADTNTLSSLDVSNNINLQTLNFDNNNVATLNLGTISNLTSIEGRYNQLSAIDLSQNPNLTFINLRDNLFAGVDVSSNPLLETINLRGCANLTSIDISNNPNLKFLYFQDTSLNGLDVSQNPLLEVIIIERVNFNSIDVSNLTNLVQLRIADNSFTSLDVSNNPALVRLVCENNNLTYLNLKNGNNINMPNGDFIATGNPSLACVLVDDATWSTTNWTNIDGTTSFSDGYCLYTAVPDTNFEAALEALGYDDISGDNQVPTKLIEVITDLNIDNESISDLTGIEAFTALEKLQCKGNSISIINLTQNLLLETLTANNNDIAAIDLSNNTALTSVNLGANDLTTLDVSNNLLLEKLSLQVNSGLTTIDISNNVLLKELRTYNSNISPLDISNNTALKLVSVYGTPITSIDLTNNPNITELRVNSTNVSSLDLSNNLAIVKLRVNNTPITTLDLSKQVALEDLFANNSSLKNLNVQNGNNTNIDIFRLTDSPSLDCILVDDATYSTTNWTEIDVHTSFNDTACTAYTYVPDDNFEAALEALGYDDVSNDNFVPTALINTLTALTIREKNISDLTGIEDFTALEYLNCSKNAITSVNVSANLAIETLFIGENQLTSIDVSANANLGYLDVGENSITSIDVSNNAALYNLDVSENNLTTIDVTQLAALTTLNISENTISTIDISANSLLKNFTADKCGLVGLDASGLTKLESLNIQSNYGDNTLNTLDVSGATSLKFLVVRYGNLSTVDISTNVNLEIIFLDGHNLTSFDMTNNPLVNFLIIGDNKFTSVDLRNGNTEGLNTLQTTNNDSLTCISIDNPAYAIANLTNIDNHTTFSKECGVYTYVPDDNFEAALGALGYDDVANDDHVPTANINTILSLDVSGENITDLTGIEAFEALTNLNVSTNTIANVDLSSNPIISTLDISNNQLVVLDLSANTALTSVNVSNNLLIYFAIQNGVNTNITSFTATTNANLECILVDSATYATTNWTAIDAQTAFNETNCTQYTAIPDANFEAALSAYDDIANDGQVPTLNIFYVKTLDVGDKSIADLTGIEDFYSLTELKCNDNSITNLDLSNNKFLQTLNAYDNALLTSLNITENTLLEYLDIDDCQLTTIDISTNTALLDADFQNNQIATINLSNNTALEILDLEDNNLTSIDVSTLVNLKELDVENNLLVTINLSSNVALEEADLDENGFVTLDLSNNINLTYLDIQKNELTTVTLGNLSVLNELDASENELTTINLSQLPSLDDLDLEENLLTSIDLSINTALKEVDVKNNELTFFSIKNGNNTEITSFEATGNSNLTCILVDDADYSTTNWTNIDVTASFSNTYCRYTAIPDTNFEAKLEALGYDDISGDNQVPTALIEVVTSLTAQYADVVDFTGLEDFTALESLTISYNSFTTLDVSNNLNLTFLNCGYSLLTSLDVSANTLLESLWVNSTNVTTLDLSANTKLTALVAGGSEDLVSLNVQNGNNTNVTQFHLLGTENLTCILVDNAAYSSTNWADVDNTASFSDTYCDSVAVAAKVFLQGAYLNPNVGEENWMRDNLRVADGLYGPNTPYSDGVTISESVGVDAAGSNSMVDWIWVELRDATDPTIVIAGKSGVLQRDGDIVDVNDDRVTPLTFEGVANGNYYIVIKHRNHISIRSASTIALSSTTTTINFSNDRSLVSGGANALIDMGSGIYAMPSGDYDGNGQIQTNDASAVISKLGTSGYHKADMDMNGQIQTTDIKELININIGKGVQF